MQVSTSEANYEFTVHFYEFRNPLGLQCGACVSGGPPACCDDVNRTENCTNENNGPLRCDTRFRFTLRPYEASVETAPDKFPHFNGGNFMPNSITFTEGPEGFNNLQNPYTITNASKWTVSVLKLMNSYYLEFTSKGFSFVYREESSFLLMLWIEMSLIELALKQKLSSIVSPLILNLNLEQTSLREQLTLVSTTYLV